MPYIKSILAIMIIFSVGIEENSSTSNSSMVKIYLDTIITTLNSIFKTILWFMIIMIASGWQIFKIVLTREEMKRYIAIYILIYIAICFDQIIDLISYENNGLVII
jgi:hypothetical protein